MRTLHVGLRVSDLERSLRFYGALGYDEVGRVPETEFGTLSMLQLPGDEFVAIELVHDPAGAPVAPSGINHLVVQVESVAEAAQRLAAHGVEAEEPRCLDPEADFWTLWLTDPDGYRLELVQWPSGHAPGMTAADFADE
ncbi:VOC family protein [Microbacterium sediminis]|uniref:Glyoxalase n=1 Tax=Microbacterium sediminis TaxID=904291 RepID=A0A1B9NIC1_9MICO|nr:VOC family protein [Microbacterium sediminis]OCG76333.1 glyoxalase [Microbacterium sediminis]QBR73121.1 VOC family protein [Microbacterium sediminis]